MPLDMRNYKLSLSAAEAAVRDEELRRRTLLLKEPLDPIDPTIEVMSKEEKQEMIRYLTTGEHSK